MQLIDWVCSNLHIDLINCRVNSQVSITEDIIQIVNDIWKARNNTKRDPIPQHKSQIDSIGSINRESFYDDESYAPNADWKIRKESEKI